MPHLTQSDVNFGHLATQNDDSLSFTRTSNVMGLKSLQGYDQNLAQSTMSSAAMPWAPNSVDTRCHVCSKPFSKLFRRKHHCRQCGKLSCDPCSNIKDFVSGYQDKKVRICTMCNAANIDQKRTKQSQMRNMVMSATTIKNPPPKRPWSNNK